MSETGLQTSTFIHSNVSLVRDADGSLSVWVGDEKILGLAAVNVSSGVLGMGIPMSHVRLAERVPATPVVILANNVLPFQKPDTSIPLTDGDSQ